MKATQFLLLGGLRVDEGQRSVAAADRITSAWMVAPGTPVPLNGCVLFAELDDDASAAKAQVVRVSVEGPPGLLVLMNGEVPFAAPEGGRRRATVVLNLDGVGLQPPGDYCFRLFAGSDELADLPLAVTVAAGAVRVRFGTPVEGRLPLTLSTLDGGFGGYLVAELERREDGVLLTLPAGFERLAHAPGFATAAERAIDRAALGEGPGAGLEVLVDLAD